MAAATSSAQTRAWLARELPPVEAVGDDIWSIPVPMPNSPLRYTSAYVLATAGSLAMVDAGWDSDDSWAALCAGLELLGATPRDVRAVLVTHQHFDHLGLAARVRAASGAWIGLHPADAEAVAAPLYRNPALALAAERRWLRRAGADAEQVDRLGGGLERFAPRAGVATADRLVEDGERLLLAGRVLRVIHTPGHTPGHLCFAEEQTGRVFTGDHVLPRISPHVSSDRTGRVDLLGAYLASLAGIAREPATEVLPAHEWRFIGLSERAQEIAEHHARRLAELLAVLRRHPGGVPWDLAAELTWSRPWAQYDGRLRITAVAETEAHLMHLVAQGRARRGSGEVPGYWALPVISGR